MPASEKERLALLNRLIEVLGREEAEVLMDSLPPVDWHQLALKGDIFALKGDIEASEQRLGTEMHAEFTKVNAELHGLRVETAAEFKTLRAENKEFRGEMALQLAKQTRTILFTMLGLAMPTWGAILAVGLS